MSFFVFAATVGGGSAILGTALIGAGVGGAYSAITGDGDILNSMLTGGLIGGAAGGIGAAITAPSTLASAPISTALTPTANALTATAPQIAAGTGASATGITSGAGAAGGMSATAKGAAGLSALTPAAVTPSLASLSTPVVTGSLLPAGYGAGSAAAGMSGTKMLGYGLAGTAAMQLLGGKGKGAGAPASDPGMIRPFDYTSTPNEPTGNYPSPYATASYDVAGNPIMDTRERNYFDQNFAAMQPYSAKTGTVNPNIPLPSSSPVSAARGGIMRNYDDEIGSDNVALDQGNMQKGLFGLGYAHGGVARFADKGMVDEEAELRKIVMNNLKKLNPEQMQNIMSNFQQEGEREKQFLVKNMPNYAAVMSPSISSMVEGAQYGDRMKQSFDDITKAKKAQMGEEFIPQTDYARFQLTDVNPQDKMYGGIASIGRQVDPDTRMNLMANLQRTPYDKNALESVRRVGAGVDRRIGKDANLSAYYEQDPMGRNKTGGVRYTQQFNRGGATDLGDYSDGGRLLRGPGDGVSDSIPATIANKQPARLADGEFVIPARIVSEIGNGSTDAGAKRLYAMMDKIQAGRKKTIGKKNVAKDTKAKKHLIV